MLATSTIAQVGPILIETAIKHYLTRKTVTKDSAAREEFLYDETFVLLKSFAEITTKHTVEELQKFSLTRTPSPPWVLLYHVLIPLPTCSEAASLLIKALGGPEQALHMCGGTKWWTVRMQPGVECEWIGIKKDFKQEESRLHREKEEKKREKEERKLDKGKIKEVLEPGHEQGQGQEQEDDSANQDGEFTPEMDNLRCMLYIHGGAYYWGSINTHRYTMWRYARKMRGRCFAVNYRKAPQFPFPCALQDCLAAYIYLLKPPPGAKHRPINPKNLIIAGDSAGGGLALALLQVIRDVGLPAPAGAVLISPWSDLTHSFPSILQNTATDIIPPYGFIHRPSTLWPPPPPELTRTQQSHIRDKVKDAVHKLARNNHVAVSPETVAASKPVDSATVPATRIDPDENVTVRGDTILETGHKDDHHPNASTLYPVEEKGVEHHPGPTDDSKHPSTVDPAEGKHQLTLQVNGQSVTVRSQIQLYCTNDQLTHPYISPALGYLGGLPPLLMITSDKEVLRDEQIYVAHKAANPERYPIRENVKNQLPSLHNIEDKYESTQVHIQIYDETCHVLPMLSMTEPAKHCYRAIASFCRFVTGHNEGSTMSPDRRSTGTTSKIPSGLAMASLDSKSNGMPEESPTAPPNVNRMVSETENRNIHEESVQGDAPIALAPPIQDPSTNGPTSESRDAISRLPIIASPTNSMFARQDSTSTRPMESPFSETGDFNDLEIEHAGSTERDRQNISVGDDLNHLDTRFPADEIRVPRAIPEGHAGNFAVYQNHKGNPWKDNMIRERVSMRGVCRPLEDASELPSLNMPLDEIGVIKEGPVMRFLNGQRLWDKKYHKVSKKIEKRRQQHLKRAQTDASKAIDIWKQRLIDKKEASAAQEKPFDEQSYLFDNEFSFTWALKGETPPPTAIVARRDTSEARNLARMGDRMTDETVKLGTLSLWTAMTSIFSKEFGSSSSVANDGSMAHKSSNGSGIRNLFSKNKT